VVEGKRVAVVVPAFQEELLVADTIRGIPDFADTILVVDDHSDDATVEQARATGDPRLEVLVHDENRGVGAAIATGYARARELGVDVTCVMAADNQMDPAELEALVAPVARGEVDYAKANRLVSGEAWKLIPRSRYLGNAVLSLLTKIASGYWHVADSQAGYTALSLDALRRLDLDRLYRRYGFPNDMLVHLNVQNARVRDVPSRPIYGVGERSGIRVRSVAPRIAWLLFKGFWWRMKEKYVIRDFHPLVFFYVLGILMTVVGFLLGVVVAASRIFGGNEITTATVVLVALLLVCQRRNDLARGTTRLRLIDRRRVEAEPRHLTTPLILDPQALLLEHAIDAGTARSLRHGEPRRLAPRHLQSPSPRPRRPPHLDRLHGARA
jgi:glycosyltransferase involved in cell wall biosynthesis